MFQEVHQRVLEGVAAWRGDPEDLRCAGCLQIVPNARILVALNLGSQNLALRNSEDCRLTESLSGVFYPGCGPSPPLAFGPQIQEMDMRFLIVILKFPLWPRPRQT